MRLKNHLVFELDHLVQSIWYRLGGEKINLPRYKCKCLKQFPCSYCKGKGLLSYSDAIAVWNILPPFPLGLQVPQCHICSAFETEHNLLFPYSIYENDNGHKFIYRCEMGHGHDSSMAFVDIQTGMLIGIK